MSFRSFIIRLVVIVLSTWVLGAIIESFWLGACVAVAPFLYYEMLRPR